MAENTVASDVLLEIDSFHFREYGIQAGICVLLGLIGTTYLWDIWTSGVAALGFNATAFAFVFLVLWGLGTENKTLFVRSQLAWVFPSILIALSFSLYENSFFKSVNIFVFPLVLAWFYNYGMVLDKENLWFDRIVMHRVFLRSTHKVIRYIRPAIWAYVSWVRAITNLDEELPGYAWDLVDLTKYRSHFWHSNFLYEQRTPFASIYTSLGCTFGCSFCMINIVNRTSYAGEISSADSKGMRHWSPEFILKEFEKLWELGVRTLRLTDEMFFLNKKYYVPILEGLIKRGLKFNLWAYARVDTVRQDQLELFKKAGVNWLCLGIESANQEVRLEIDKGRFRKINIREVVQQIKDAGIAVLGNYIFGFPEDNFYTMNETLNLALELNCEHTNFYCATALPGSPLYLQAKRYGWDLPQTYEEFAFLSYEHKPLQTKYLSAAQVLRFRDDAWHRVFNDPPFHQLVKNRFGQEALDNVKDLSKIKLQRKLLNG